MKEAVQKHPEVDVMVNFASLRSAYGATVEAMNYEQVSRYALLIDFCREYVFPFFN